MSQPAQTTVLQAAQVPESPITVPVRFDAEQLISKAIDKNLPVEALERLLAMRERLKAESAREAFHAALSEFQASCPVIPKDCTAKVTSQRGNYTYHYADLATIGRTIGPLLKGCRLSFRFDTEFQDDPPALIVRAIISHAEGHSESSEFRSPIDAGARMNVIQQSGSALTYGKRYALCNALGILTGDEDDDGQSHRPPAERPSMPPKTSAPPKAPPAHINKSQVQRLGAMIRNLGLDAERVRDWCKAKWNVERAEDLTYDQWKVLVGINEQPGKLHAFRKQLDQQPLTEAQLEQVAKWLEGSELVFEDIAAPMGYADLREVPQGKWGEVTDTVTRMRRVERQVQWDALPEEEKRRRTTCLEGQYHQAQEQAGRSGTRGT